jgi:molybdopterin/thiamine biosynthesis adenylyltransferase
VVVVFDNRNCVALDIGGLAAAAAGFTGLIFPVNIPGLT